MSRPYVDTSALAKWFFNEKDTGAFVAFADAQRSGLSISTLTIVEFRSLVSRRERAGLITSANATTVLARFNDLVRRSVLVVHSIGDAEFENAAELIEQFGTQEGLTTLDALQLAAAQASGVTVFATADRVLGKVGALSGFEVTQFG